MKIFLATCSFDEARWASTCGFLDGVLVSPAYLNGEMDNAPARAVELARLFACPVILSSGARDADQIVRDGREVIRESSDVILELPLGVDTVEGIHRATLDGVSVAASMVFTSAQALLAAKAGAAAVLVHMTALEAQGQNATTTLGEMRRIFDVHRLECEIIAVTPTSAGQVALCAASGVDAVVLEPSVLRDLLLHPLADHTLDDLLTSSQAPSRSRST